jgi:hypothetical protein
MIELFHRIAVRPQQVDAQSLRDTVQVSGGRVVEYVRAASIIFYSEMMPCREWVPPDASRSAAGLKHALVSLLLGWWSPTGLLLTMAVVLNDLAGGVDVTMEFLPDKTVRHQEAAAAQARDLRRNAFIVNLSFIIWALALIGVTVYFVRTP